MNDKILDSPSAIKSFLEGSGKLELSVPKGQRYAWLGKTLKRTGYLSLSKKDKSIVRKYFRNVTGYSPAQLTRLIKQYQTHHWIGKKAIKWHRYARRYT